VSFVPLENTVLRELWSQGSERVHRRRDIAIPLPIHSITIMENLLAPTRRYQDRFGLDTGYNDEGPFEYTEVKIIVPLKDFQTWNWEDLRAFVAGGVMRTILWITEDVFLVVVIDDGEMFALRDAGITECMHAEFRGTSGQLQMLLLASISHANRPVTKREVSVFWRALMTSNSVKVSVVNSGHLGQASGRVPPQFLRGSTSLQNLVFWGFHFKKDHYRALATIKRTDLDLQLCQCKLDPQDAGDTFIEWFRHNQIVTGLDRCQIESDILSGLSGNNSVKRLVIQKRPSYFGEEEMRSLLQALPSNMGINDLTVYDFQMSDEPSSLLFRALSTHPRIKSVHILKNSFSRVSYSAAAKSTVMNAILQMLQHNTVVHTIRLPDVFDDEAVYQNAILPRLEMNRSCFEVQRQAVKRADPSIRPQLLGRALHVVQYNSDLVFRFLSENVPAFVRTREVDGVDEEEDPAIPSMRQQLLERALHVVQYTTNLFTVSLSIE
jgi:hypothetical protein